MRLTSDTIDRCIRALGIEIKHVKHPRNRQRLLIHDGQLIDGYGRYALYRFSADREVKLPDDTGVQLDVPGATIKGFLVSTEGYQVVLALEEQRGPLIERAELHSEPSFILEELQDRLNEIKQAGRFEQAGQLLQWRQSDQRPSEGLGQQILESVASSRGKPFEPVPNVEQQRAVAQILNNRVSYIWGPPGTGKTRTLGLTVGALVDEGKTVLVVTHSNVALDVAMQNVGRVVQGLEAYADGRVLRYGPPSRADLFDDFPNLHIRGIAIQHLPDLMRKINQLETRKKTLFRQTRHGDPNRAIDEELSRIQEELRPRYNELENYENRLIKNAQVIGCTLSKAAIDDLIYQGEYDAVVLDEASMARLPDVFFISSLARRRVAVFGDFRQLPPIAQSARHDATSREWLARDIFDGSGVINEVEEGRDVPNMVMLREQYRMHPDIVDIPNDLFYNQQLRTPSNVESWTAPIIERSPLPERSLLLLDVSRHGYCFRDDRGRSRFNPISALALVQAIAPAALDGLRGNSLALITPYAPQVRLLNAMIHDLGLEGVQASTVHRFQGSEQDIVGLDLVEGPPLKPGLLVKETQKALRLINVAISRARGKLLVVGNVSYALKKFSQEKDPVPRLISKLNRQGIRDSAHCANWQSQIDGLRVFTSQQEAVGSLSDDLRQVQGKIGLKWKRDMHMPISESAIDRMINTGVDVRYAGTEHRASHVPFGIVSLDEELIWICPDTEQPDGPSICLAWPKTARLLHAFFSLDAERFHLDDQLQDRSTLRRSQRWQGSRRRRTSRRQFSNTTSKHTIVKHCKSCQEDVAAINYRNSELICWKCGGQL